MSSSALEPTTAWWTDSRSVEPQRTQRLPSRSLAARRSFCHVEPLSSGREEPERWAGLQTRQRPRSLAGRSAPQREHTRVRRGDGGSSLASNGSLGLASQRSCAARRSIRRAYLKVWMYKGQHKHASAQRFTLRVRPWRLRDAGRRSRQVDGRRVGSVRRSRLLATSGHQGRPLGVPAKASA
jgi:hypothetical protein